MRYVSTRGQAPALSFEEAMLSGLARDGGLYVPEAVPQIGAREIAGLAGLSYGEAAFRLMRPFIGDCFSDTRFRDIIARAYHGFSHNAVCPISQLGHNEFLLELFHGPTLAFKDVAMQLIGQMFEVVLWRRGQRATIVGATSGDTGSAAIEAFRGLDAVDVFILYPHGRVSEVQRRQMTTPSEANAHAIAVEGDFDDCQALVKAMFNDFGFRDEVALAGVNSINWARVMAQIVYYFTAAVSLGAPHRAVSFSVPTGNFGDIFAGYMAKRMGLPIDRLVIATNQNGILHRMAETGVYARGTVVPSMSPSMDIQVSSNFERLLFDLDDREGAAVAQQMEEFAATGRFALSQGTQARLHEEFDSSRVSEQETLSAIRVAAEQSARLVCPHTAVGFWAAIERRDNPAVPMVVLGTAHPAKFPDAVEQATGQRPEFPARMADLYDRPERVSVVANDLTAVEALIRRKRRP